MKETDSFLPGEVCLISIELICTGCGYSSYYHNAGDTVINCSCSSKCGSCSPCCRCKKPPWR